MINMLLEVRKYGNAILREKAQPVKEITQEIKALINNMAETMYRYEGIGLAAPQVGIGERIITADIGDGLIAVANPEVLHSSGVQTGQEGCLSLPGIVLEIERAGEIVVEGLNAEGKRVELRASDLFARVLQHEIDHLNGLLIIDRISLAKRQLISSKLKKLEKETKGRLSPEI